MTALATDRSLAVHRLEQLLDGLTDVHLADGAATGHGLANGVPVVAFATDPGVQGGALGRSSCAALVEATDTAVALHRPVVGLWHSGGARLREGVGSLDAVGRLFAAQVRASGRVPQLSVVLGPAAGGAAYGPALTDVVVLAPRGRVLVTGPDVVRSVTGEDVDLDRLGGPDTHARRSGVVHLVAGSDDAALDCARTLAALLGAPGRLRQPGSAPDPGPLVPADPRKSYDVRPVVRALLDAGSVVELHAGWASHAVTALGRLAGRTVGVVANDPQRLAGCLDAETGDKTARFVQMCDAYGVPLVFLVDVPGYLPGVAQEDNAVLRRGAKLLHAYAACRVPRLTVVLRKAYGGAFIAMGSKGLGADAVLAWPGAQVDVMGAAAAVEVLYRRELAAAPAGERDLVRQRLAAHHEATTGGLARALECGAVDRVVEPARTREVLVALLSRLPEARGEHRNGPL